MKLTKHMISIFHLCQKFSTYNVNCITVHILASVLGVPYWDLPGRWRLEGNTSISNYVGT